MFRKVVRRFNLGALLVVALGVVALSGAGGSFAGLPSVTTQPYPLEHADRALADLAADRVNGAAVLVNP